MNSENDSSEKSRRLRLAFTGRGFLLDTFFSMRIWNTYYGFVGCCWELSFSISIGMSEYKGLEEGGCGGFPRSGGSVWMLVLGWVSCGLLGLFLLLFINFRR